MKRIIAGTVLLAAVLIAGALFGPGCEPPVSDEATVRAFGVLLNTDGTPAAGVTVRLQKTDALGLDLDVSVGSIVNADATAFKQVTTDAQGYYEFVMSGAEANVQSGSFASYFFVYAVSPTDLYNQLAVATEAFHFSNQNLDKEMPELRFWDLEPAAVTTNDQTVKVTWADTPVAPKNGRYLVIFGNGSWAQEVDGNSLEIPLTALQPCINPVVDSPDKCQPLKTHAVQVISLAEGIRYRTAAHLFDAENPKGIGVWYRMDQAGDARSAETCSGKAIFDVNDGVFWGPEGTAKLVGQEGLSAADLRCLRVDLGNLHQLSEIWMHNATVLAAEKAIVEVSVTPDDPADPAAVWTVAGQWTGAEQSMWYSYIHVETDATARGIRFQFTDTEQSEPFWIEIGEISIYGTILVDS